jgi:serine/threonine protein kinase
MPAPTTVDDFLQFARKSGQLDGTRLDDYLAGVAEALPDSPRKLAVRLIRAGVMTTFQAEQFLQGKHKGFRLGTYRIIDRLGTGGAGLVYLARHEVLGKRFAIKVLPQACAGDPGVLERFRREARAAAALDHPNVMQVYDFREEDGMSYLVMEYVEGPTLQQLLHRRGRLDIATACEYARQAALGLQHAHEHGLVHRDVKPGNLMVDAGGTVKVLDLGLARYEADAEKEGESLTKLFNSNQVLGTSDYLSPEQALSLHDVDGRADIYSLGATLYALLTGKPPFPDGSIAKKLMLHQTEMPTPVHAIRPEVPEDLSDLIAKMLAKKPDDRFASAGVVALALARWADAASPSGLQPSNQTLAEIRINPRAGLISSSTGAAARPGGLSPDTVMAADDTMSPDRGKKATRPQKPSDPPAVPPTRGGAGRRRAPLLALIGAALCVAAGVVGWVLLR